MVSAANAQIGSSQLSIVRLLIDQDFNQHIIRGLRARIPELDALSAFEAGLSEALDSILLAHAALTDRVLLTHDRKTMPSHAAVRIAEGQPMPGLFVVPRRLQFNQVVDDLEIIVTCSLENEWNNIVRYLPL